MVEHTRVANIGYAIVQDSKVTHSVTELKMLKSLLLLIHPVSLTPYFC